MEVTRDLPEVEVAGVLDQILDVLIDNAIRYAGPGARVELSATETADGVVGWVRDDGPGLEHDEWDLATERFWRSGDRRTGSGLGLAIAEELAAANGGRVRLRPAEPVGTIAEFSLRVAS